MIVSRIRVIFIIALTATCSVVLVNDFDGITKTKERAFYRENLAISPTRREDKIFLKIISLIFQKPTQ